MRRPHPEIIKLLTEIEMYLRATGLSYTRFGQCACGNVHTIQRLQRGVMPRLDKIERIRNYMHDHPHPQLPKRKRKAK